MRHESTFHVTAAAMILSLLGAAPEAWAQVPPGTQQMIKEIADSKLKGAQSAAASSKEAPAPDTGVSPVAPPPPPPSSAAAPSSPAPAAAPAAAPGPDARPAASGGAGGGEVKRTAPRTPMNAKISLDYQDIELSELVKKMSEMTGTNFILTEPLQGKKITIISPTMITLEEAYQVFLSVLKSSGYALVPLGHNFRVVPVSTVASEPIPTTTEGGKPGEQFVTRLFKVQNMEVDQISNSLGKLISPNGSIITYAPTNTLIMTDTVTNIERIIDIIQRLDVESPTEKLVIVPIRFADATQIADTLLQVFGDDQTSSSTSRRNTPTPTRQSRRQQAAPQPTNGPATSSMGGESPKISKVIADERTNALIILATEKALEDIVALISKLDVDVDESMKSDIHVIYLKYAKAEELASTLANLAGTGSGGVASSTSTRSRTSSTNTNSRTNNQRSNSQFGRPGSTQNRSGVGGSMGGDVATFEGGVRITADPPTNALVITASYNDYQTIKRVIEQLDIRRKQVFVEAVILELSQDKSGAMGLNYHGGLPGEGNLGGALFGRGSQSLSISDPNLLAGLAVGVFGTSISAPSTLASALSGGSTTELEIPAFGIVLQAMQQDKDVNILSTPSILTSNNQEAKIIVGQNVPFQSGSTFSSMMNNISITREDVALTLRITPQVNESNEVTLEVFQEITEVVPGSKEDTLGPTTTKRSAETVVSVPDNQTAVIGGLISAKENVVEDKVPILGDIPLIGFLFRSRTTTVSKSNLLIFLTPHIIDTEEDLQNVYLIKMAQRQEFIRRFYGKSQEEQIKELESLMKYSMNLPDVPPLYPERTTPKTMETTIETKVNRRGFVAPIPGADPNQSGPIVVPVFSPESVEQGGSSPAPEGAPAPVTTPEKE